VLDKEEKSRAFINFNVNVIKHKSVNRQTITLINFECFFLEFLTKKTNSRYKNRLHPPVAYIYRRSLDNNKTRIEAERNLSKAREEIRESGKVGRENWMVCQKIAFVEKNAWRIHFLGMIPDWCQVPFNLTGMHERSITDWRILNATIDDFALCGMIPAIAHVNRSWLVRKFAYFRSFRSFLLPLLLPSSRLPDSQLSHSKCKNFRKILFARVPRSEEFR